MKNCWKVLGIRPTNNLDAIKSARRVLVKTWHPDRAESLFRKQLCDLRCAQINAAFDEAIERAKILGRYVDGSVHDTKVTPAEVKRSFARAFLSNPLTWLCASSFLIVTRRIPVLSLPAPGTLMFGLASTVALNFSRNMMRTCAANQRSNWLLLLVASAVVFLVSLHDVSARALGTLPAHIIVIGAAVALPFWIIGFRHAE